MKKTLLLALLLTLSATTAHAADPALIKPEIQAIKEKAKPVISKKIKPGMMRDKAKQDYHFEAGDIAITTDPATCEKTWAMDLTNTGTTSYSGDLEYYHTLHYMAAGTEKEKRSTALPIANTTPGVKQHLSGLISNYAAPKKLVVNVTGNGQVLTSKEHLFSNETGAYTISLGDLQASGGHITIPLSVSANETQTIPAIAAIISAYTAQGQGFPVHNEQFNCVSAGQTYNVTFPLPTQAYVTLHVDVREPGAMEAKVMRDYTNNE